MSALHFKALWVAAGFCWTTAAFAQQTDSLEAARKTLNQSLIFEVSQIEGSRSISYGALRDFLYSEGLDESVKLDLSDALQTQNNYGNAFEARIAFRQWSPKRKLGAQRGFEFGIENTQVFGARFSEDAAKLALFGNAGFEGQTARLDPMDYELASWFQAYFEQMFRTDVWQYTVGLGFVIGNEYERFELDRGSLYTAENGEYLDVDAQYELLKAGETGFVKGLGASLRASVEHSSVKGWKTRLGFRDLGYVHWNSLSTTVSADSSFRYSGEEFPNIFDLRDSLLLGTDDRLDRSFFSSEESAFGSWLPFELSAGIERDLNAKKGLDGYGLSVVYRALPGMIPRTTAFARWAIDRWYFAPELSYGGFTGAGLGISIGHRSNDWEWQVRARDLQGPLAPQWGGGFGLDARLRYRLY